MRNLCQQYANPWGTHIRPMTSESEGRISYHIFSLVGQGPKGVNDASSRNPRGVKDASSRDPKDRNVD